MVRCCNNVVDDGGVTFETGLVGNLPVAFVGNDIVGKPSGGESKRVPKTVLRFGHVFADEVRRRMAIVAGCDRAMRGFQPTVVMILHDVAVCACGRIIGQIRRAFGINKRVADNANRDSQHTSRDYAFDDTRPHVPFVLWEVKPAGAILTIRKDTGTGPEEGSLIDNQGRGAATMKIHSHQI